MRTSPFLLSRAAATLLILLLSSFFALAADSAAWAGQYRNDKFLAGRAVFQLTIEQSGGATQVSFDAAWNDGHGAAPEASGPATISGDQLTFKFEDSFGNSGTGAIKRSGNDILVTIDPKNVVETRCLQFYGTNMRLKRVAKK
jgi:hypothetical protein